MHNDLEHAHIMLWDIAHRDTGQAVCIRRFLLNLFNGFDYQFSLIDLRGLDDPLFEACMLLLRHEHYDNFKEIHIRLGVREEEFIRVVKY